MSTLYMVSAAYYTDQGDIPMHIYHLLEALQRSVKVSDVKQSCPPAAASTWFWHL